jgi:hypothetical protein
MAAVSTLVEPTLFGPAVFVMAHRTELLECPIDTKAPDCR